MNAEVCAPSRRPNTSRVLPSLTALRAFEAVGRTGSVRAAGDELAISHTVVSRHVRQLQETLGVVLVEAKGRGVGLTAAGLDYHVELAKAFDLIRTATGAVRAVKRRTLDFWSTPGIVHRRLLPKMPELVRALPHSEINLRPTLTIPEIGRDQVDAVLIYSDNEPANGALQAECLVRPRVFPVASPSLIARYPNVERPADILALPLLHEESISQWEHWLVAVRHKTEAPVSGQRLWHAHLALDAARLGQGVALANELLVEAELREGTLVELLSTDVRLGGYHFIASASRWNEAGIVALKNWVSGALAGSLR